MLPQTAIRRLKGRYVVIFTEEGEIARAKLARTVQTEDGIQTIQLSQSDHRELYNDMYSKYDIEGWRLENGNRIVDISEDDSDEGVDMTGGHRMVGGAFDYHKRGKYYLYVQKLPARSFQWIMQKNYNWIRSSGFSEDVFAFDSLREVENAARALSSEFKRIKYQISETAPSE